MTVLLSLMVLFSVCGEGNSSCLSVSGVGTVCDPQHYQDWCDYCWTSGLTAYSRCHVSQLVLLSSLMLLSLWLLS
ncbi:hypothetical protein J4Q44_G00130180 [Coregonus suidteri]|uniref:Uncharacterized protein n=1 Tax=Coregonus suidteri TaxID=861788 RepID=A0AAN8LV53_9TELE